jgi:hypothetical protein
MFALCCWYPGRSYKSKWLLRIIMRPQTQLQKHLQYYHTIIRNTTAATVLQHHSERYAIAAICSVLSNQQHFQRFTIGNALHHNDGPTRSEVEEAYEVPSGAASRWRYCTPTPIPTSYIITTPSSVDIRETSTNVHCSCVNGKAKVGCSNKASGWRAHRDGKLFSGHGHKWTWRCGGGREGRVSRLGSRRDRILSRLAGSRTRRL